MRMRKYTKYISALVCFQSPKVFLCKSRKFKELFTVNKKERLIISRISKTERKRRNAF